MPKKLLSLCFIAVYLIVCYAIYQAKPQKKEVVSSSSIVPTNIITSQIKAKEKPEQTPLILLSIPKIELQQEIYSLEDKRNNVEEHVTLLKESVLPNLFLLAAHSGDGPKAFFTRLKELTVKDQIKLSYQKEELLYQIEKIEEQEKNGTIQIIKKNTPQLILTTCSERDKNKQLVLIATLIKKS